MNRQQQQQQSRRPLPFPARGTASRVPPYLLIPFGAGSLALVYGYYSFLDSSPTGRKRLLATSPQWERQMGDEEYRRMMAQNRSNILPADHRAAVTVRRVGSRIAQAANKYASQNLPAEYVKGQSKPTYTVIRSDQANAFVLPNNHVFVLTGLFRYARDEDELASVLGHEMAHCLARHAGERVSGGLVVSLIVRLTLLADPTGMLAALFIPAATLLHDLPHSREQEVEADEIGLFLASEACYDPRAAKHVFSRMKDDDGGGKSSRGMNTTPPEFISTHPSYDTRLQKFDEWMPKALTTYNADGGNRCRHVRDEMKCTSLGS